MNIEELAFKDRKILANLNAVDLLNIIEFLQDDRRQCLEELSKTHNRSVEIQKENQELKSQLAGTTHCFDEEEHEILKKQLHEASLTIQEMVEQDIECPSNCEKLRKLKKQLEEYIKQNMKLKDELFVKRKEYQDIYKDVRIEIKEYKTQQKEFIKYLEDEIKELQKIKETELDYDILKDVIPELLVFEDVLQKHKEIIGVSDEKEN